MKRDSEDGPTKDVVTEDEIEERLQKMAMGHKVISGKGEAT